MPASSSKIPGSIPGFEKSFHRKTTSGLFFADHSKLYFRLSLGLGLGFGLGLGSGLVLGLGLGSRKSTATGSEFGSGWEWWEYILQWAQRRFGNFQFWDEPVSFAWITWPTCLVAEKLKSTGRLDFLWRSGASGQRRGHMVDTAVQDGGATNHPVDVDKVLRGSWVTNKCLLALCQKRVRGAFVPKVDDVTGEVLFDL